MDERLRPTKLYKTGTGAITLANSLNVKLASMGDHAMTENLFTLKTKASYRRKQVTPGLHLLQFFKRGTSVVAASSHGQIRASVFDFKPNGTTINGLLGEARGLQTGVNAFPNRVQAEQLQLQEEVQEATNGLVGSGNYPKMLGLNLLGKTQIRMMQVMLMQAEASIQGVSEFGRAAVAYKHFQDSLPYAGVGWTYQQNSIADQKVAISFSRQFGRQPSTELIGMYNPFEIEAYGDAPEDHNVTGFGVKQLAALGLIKYEEDLYNKPGILKLLANKYRCKRLIEQKIRLENSFEQDSYWNLISQDYDPIDTGKHNWARYIQNFREDKTVQAQPGFFTVCKDWIAVRNTQFIPMSLTNYDTTRIVDGANGISYEKLRTRFDIIDVPNSKIGLEKIVGGVAVKEQANALVVDAVTRNTINNTFETNWEVLSESQKLQNQYRLMAQAGIVLSSFKKMVGMIKSVHSRYPRNPYWVDCYFGTVLSMGEDTKNIIDNPEAGLVEKFQQDSVRLFAQMSFGSTTVNVENEYSGKTRSLVHSKNLDRMIFRAAMSGNFSAEELDGAVNTASFTQSLANSMRDLGFINATNKKISYGTADREYRESLMDREDTTTIRVSDPSGAKFNTEMITYDIPLGYKSSKQNLQTAYALQYAQAKGKGYKFNLQHEYETNYYQRAFTVPTLQIGQMINDFAKALTNPKFEAADKPLCIPITVFERLLYDSFVQGGDRKYKLAIGNFQYQCKTAFHVMYRQYTHILQMYIEVGYTKVADYDIYYILESMQTYLQEFTRGIDRVMQLLGTEEFNMDQNSRRYKEHLLFMKWVEKVMYRSHSGEYYPLYDRIPKYRTKVDKLNQVSDGMREYREGITRAARDVQFRRMRDPWREEDDDEDGFYEYKKANRRMTNAYRDQDQLAQPNVLPDDQMGLKIKDLFDAVMDVRAKEVAIQQRFDEPEETLSEADMSGEEEQSSEEEIIGDQMDVDMEGGNGRPMAAAEAGNDPMLNVLPVSNLNARLSVAQKKADQKSKKRAAQKQKKKEIQKTKAEKIKKIPVPQTALDNYLSGVNAQQNQ